MHESCTCPPIDCPVHPVPDAPDFVLRALEHECVSAQACDTCWTRRYVAALCQDVEALRSEITALKT